MCGTNRPTDWFSQKFCAAQYGKLLENVETPKRKKRTATERDNPTDVTIIPGELIVRKLVQERTVELKKLVEEEQREYRQLAQEIRLLQSDALDEAQVLAMWEQIENENREKEKEQQKHAQWLREREEKKIEMERAWRPGAVVTASMSPTSNSNSSGSPSRSSPSLFLKATGVTASTAIITTGQMTPKVELMDQQGEAPDTPLKPGTSPLLTSLLKSPSSTPSTPTAQTSTRSLAPTITNLLTGVQPVVVVAPSTAGVNPPAYVATPTVPNSSAAFFSFPSKHPQHQSPGTATTPSKAAPTLSKLLDPNRSKSNAGGGGNEQQINAGAVTGNSDEDVINIDDQQLMEVFKELMPDDLADILTDNHEMIVSPELLDHHLEQVQELIQPTVAVRGGAVSAGGGVSVEVAPITEGKGGGEEVVVVVPEEVRGEEGKVVANPVEASKNDSVETELVVSSGAAKHENQSPVGEEEEGPVVVAVDSSSQEVVVVVEEDEEDDDDMMELDDTVTPTVQDDDDVQEGGTVEEATEQQQQEEKKVPVTVQDNLEEQLAAITNGGEVEMEETEPTTTTTTAVDENPLDDDVAELISEEPEEKEELRHIEEAEEDDEAGQGEVDEEMEELPMGEHEDSETETERNAEGADSEDQQHTRVDVVPGDEQETEEEKETESEQEMAWGHKVPGQPMETKGASTATMSGVEKQSSRVEERKGSTDNEDQFEDAKSTVGGDSGNPPEDVNELPTETAVVSEPQHEEMHQSKRATPEMTNTPDAVSDRSSRSKRDMPRRNRSQTGGAATEDKTPTVVDRRGGGGSHLMEDSGEETKSSSASNISLRTRLKERERSESPLVMDEDSTSDLVIPRTRRRYSSTPVIDSVPSSPASGDDREYKNWKKTVLIAFNQFSTLHYKYSAVLVQQVPEEFRHIIMRPMDMQTIKRNIETGVIRTTTEFQRDVLLMVQNAVMMNTRRDRDWTNLIDEMMVEVAYWKRETEKNLSSREGESSGGGQPRDAHGKVRNRKSMRITTAS